MKVELDNSLFWEIYNTLRDVEGVLWSCDGATNPEDETLTQDITEANKDIARVLDKLQPIVQSLKKYESV